MAARKLEPQTMTSRCRDCGQLWYEHRQDCPIEQGHRWLDSPEGQAAYQSVIYDEKGK